MVEDDSDLRAPLELPEDETRHTPSAPQPIPPKKSKKKWLIIGLVFALVLAAGAAWWFLRPRQEATQPQTTEQTNSAAPRAEYQASGETKSYTNDIMRLTIAYPANWTVAEEGSSVFIQSPDFTYNTVGQGEVTGNFRVYIRLGAQTADSKVIGRGYAVEPSEKLVYTSPTETQRKETNLTNFGLDEPNNFGFFLIAGNFSLQKGETLGPNYGKETDTFIIGGGFSAKDKKDGLDTNKVPLDEYKQSTAYKQAVDMLKTIQIK